MSTINDIKDMLSQKLEELLQTKQAEVVQKAIVGESEEVEELSDEQILEDILALDEISKETLGSYIKKATKQTGLASYYQGREDEKEPNVSKRNTEGSDLAKKRIKGITKATDKLTKEQKDQIETILSEIDIEEGRIDDLRDRRAAKIQSDEYSTSSIKSTASVSKRVIKGTRYGGSNQKPDDNNDLDVVTK